MISFVKKKNFLWAIIIFISLGFFLLFFFFISPNKIEYLIEPEVEVFSKIIKEEIIQDSKTELNLKSQVEEEVWPVFHLKTPEKVKAIYMSSWVAGSPNFRDSLIKMIDETELNAVVIDIKDSTGRISFEVADEQIISLGSVEKRISNIRWLTNLLHQKNIYIIGRISVFQDPYLTKVKPEWAILRKSDGGIWKDRKGLSFLDPANKEVYQYTLNLALASYEVGFDEINFDYIRYPSDGNMQDIDYKLKDGKSRADFLEDFFKFLSTEIKKEKDIIISADLFGLTTEAVDDMGIGQIWERALPYFDYLAPMVYPSHYASGYSGYQNPSLYPYEVVYRSIAGAINRTKAMGYDINKIRPWLQDFDIGATYTKEMIRAQIKAVNDLGIYSWMLWDPSNKYTREALKIEIN